jgi:hypothetical protein
MDPQTGPSESMKQSLELVEILAENYCTDFSENSCLQFVNAYEAALTLQVRSPLDKKTELLRSAWLDIARWTVVRNITKLRIFRTHMMGLGRLFSKPSYNPWCNFCLTFGGGCGTCPLVVGGLISKDVCSVWFAENSFLRCSSEGGLTYGLAAAFKGKDFASIKGIVKAAMSDSGELVKFWDKVGKND